MGGGRGGLPDTKRGGGQSTPGPIYEKWGGGAWQFASGPLRKGGGGAKPRQVQKLRKPGPAPHKRTLTLLGGGGGGGGFHSNPPNPPWLRACM